MQRKNRVAIGLGTNLGDRLFHIQSALTELENIFGPITVSSLVESAALLLEDAPSEWNLPFLNCAATAHTHLSAHEVLRELKRIEKKLGRVEAPRWSPRIIDLDLLLYEDLELTSSSLQIPHKELLNRPFVLQPLTQLLPYWKYPVKTSWAFGKTLLELQHQAPARFESYGIAYPYLVGIVNITPNSYSDGGLFLESPSAILQAETLWNDGASWIDLGACSLKPRSQIISAQEEWSRLEPVLSSLRKKNPAMRLSVNTCHHEIAKRALESFDIAMINFMGEDLPSRFIEKLFVRKKKLVLTHTLTLPPTKETVLPYEENPMFTVLSWGSKTLENIQSLLGLSNLTEIAPMLILDPGISFGKTRLQSLRLLQQIERLEAWNIPLMISSSRKGFIELFSSKPPAQRDSETATISCYLINRLKHPERTYLRVHNVKEHREQLTTLHALLSV